MQKNKTNKVKISDKNLKIAIILPYFHEKYGLEMLKNTKEELTKNGVKKITIHRVAGALELPFAVKKIIKKEKPDAVITLGIIIKGETDHYDLVKDTCYQGLMAIQLKTTIPIIFGVLACKTEKQAKERVSKKGLDKGTEAAKAALIQTKI